MSRGKVFTVGVARGEVWAEVLGALGTPMKCWTWWRDEMRLEGC